MNLPDGCPSMTAANTAWRSAGRKNPRIWRLLRAILSSAIFVTPGKKEDQNECSIRNQKLEKYFHVPDGWLHAVDDVSFFSGGRQNPGNRGRVRLRQINIGPYHCTPSDSTEGEICFDGKRITNARGKELKKLHTDMQIIFQDPFSSLNPSMTVKQIIAGTAALLKELSAGD